MCTSIVMPPKVSNTCRKCYANFLILNEIGTHKKRLPGLRRSLFMRLRALILGKVSYPDIAETNRFTWVAMILQFNWQSSMLFVPWLTDIDSFSN